MTERDARKISEAYGCPIDLARAIAENQRLSGYRAILALGPGRVKWVQGHWSLDGRASDIDQITAAHLTRGAPR